MSSWLGEGLPPPSHLGKETLLLGGRSLTEQDDDDEEELIFDHTSLLNRRHMTLDRGSGTGVCSRLYRRLRCCWPSSVGGHIQVARTFNLCLSFFALGLCFAIPTATLDDLQKSVDAGEEVKNIYTARYSGYLFGALIGGFLFDRYNRQFLLFLSLLATGVGVLVMPFCKALGGLMACTAVTGITMGFLDTGGNVWCLDLWGRRSAPVMQGMHFCFGLGAFLAPLVAEPFLTPHAAYSGVSTMHNPLGGPNATFLGNRSNSSQLHMPSVGLPHHPLGGSHHKHTEAMENVLHSGESAFKRFRRSDNGSNEFNSSISEEFDNQSIDNVSLELIAENSTVITNKLKERDKNSNLTINTDMTSLVNVSTSTPVSSTTDKVVKKKPKYAEGNILHKESKWELKKKIKDRNGNIITTPPPKTTNATSSAESLSPLVTVAVTLQPNEMYIDNMTEYSLEINDTVGNLSSTVLSLENDTFVNNASSFKTNEDKSVAITEESINVEQSPTITIKPALLPTQRNDLFNVTSTTNNIPSSASSAATIITSSSTTASPINFSLTSLPTTAKTNPSAAVSETKIASPMASDSSTSVTTTISIISSSKTAIPSFTTSTDIILTVESSTPKSAFQIDTPAIVTTKFSSTIPSTTTTPLKVTATGTTSDDKPNSTAAYITNSRILAVTTTTTNSTHLPETSTISSSISPASFTRISNTDFLTKVVAPISTKTNRDKPENLSLENMSKIHEKYFEKVQTTQSTDSSPNISKINIVPHIDNKIKSTSSKPDQLKPEANSSSKKNNLLAIRPKWSDIQPTLTTGKTPMKNSSKITNSSDNIQPIVDNHLPQINPSNYEAKNELSKSNLVITDLPLSHQDSNTLPIEDDTEDELKNELNRSGETSEDANIDPTNQNSTEEIAKKSSDIFGRFFDLLNQNKLGRFEIPYVLLSVYIFMVALLFLVFLCRNPRELRSKQDEELDHSWEPSAVFRIPMVSLMVLFFCLYVGMEVAVGQLLETFATKEDLQLSRARGYFLPHLFWGSFAVARGLSICVAMQFSGRCMLLTNLSICLVASVMLVAGADKLEALLWIGIVLLGFGMAPLFPTAISWIEGYLRVTNKMASVFILGAAIGEIVLPTVISIFINQEPMVLMYVNILVNALCFVCFLVLCVMASRQSMKYAYKPSRSLYQLANTEADDEGATEMVSTNVSPSNGHALPVRRKPGIDRLF